MEFRVSSAVFDAHPDLLVGIIAATNIDNTGSYPELEIMLRNEEERVRSSFDAETFKEHPKLAALQEVHRSFGNNPNKFPPSIQALIKRVVKGGSLPIINPVVDAYNIISLRHVICAGAEDTDVCEGVIRLDYADGTEHFVPLGEAEEQPPVEGELLYKDDKGVICRKLNWREADRTKITNETKNAVLVLEAFPPCEKEELEAAVIELQQLLVEKTGCNAPSVILSKENPTCDLVAL